MATGLNQDTAVMRGVRTALQAATGALVSLVVALWSVPGVPDVVAGWLQQNTIGILLGVGIPAGLAAFIWGALRKDVKTV